MNFPVYIRNALLILFVFNLVACGGGGDTTSNIGGLTLSSSNITFETYQNEAVAPSQSITASWSDANVAAVVATLPLGTSLPAWLDVSTSGTTSPVTFTFSNTTSNLAIGTQSVTLNISSYDSNANLIETRILTISINIKTRLGISGPASLSFSMISGALAPSDQTVSLTGNGINWTASENVSWLSLNNISGTAPSTVSVGIDPTGLAVGIYNTDITFTDTESSEQRTVGVELRVEPHKITVTDTGVALSSTPSLSRVSRTIKVTENANISTDWSASTDQSWLSVTTAGYTGDDLVLTADPNGLATDTIHYATVTVTSSDPTVTNTEQVKVGFWVGTVTPSAINTLALTYLEIVTDPIRPYVYMNSGGTAIDIYNVHTASLVTTITNVGAALGDMEISSDGSTLYVADLTNYDIVPISLDTLTVNTAWNVTGSGNLWLAYGRVDNKPFIFAGNGTVYDADSGVALPNTFDIGGYYYGGSVLNVSQNGKTMCGVKVGLSPYTIECFQLRYSSLGTGALTMTSLGDVRGPGGNVKDVALIHDGTRAYVASGSPYNFIGFDMSTMLQDQTLPANAYPNCVEISPDNLLYGGTSSWYGSLDVWIYDISGVEQNSYYLSGYADNIRDRQLAVSGDGLRMITSVTDPAVKFVTAP